MTALVVSDSKSLPLLPLYVNSCKELGIVDTVELARVKVATEGAIYGSEVTHYLAALVSRDFQSTYELSDRRAAFLYMVNAAVARESLYYLTRPELAVPGAARDSFLAALAPVKAAIAEGGIPLIESKFAMTPQEGAAFARAADLNLGNESHAVQQLLAEINYARFTSSTMYSGHDCFTDTLRQGNSVEWNIQSGNFTRMPHLRISNMGIGAVVGGIFRANLAPSGGRQRILFHDFGAGTGATTAAAYIAVAEVLKRSTAAVSNEIRFQGNEPNRFFFTQLGGAFTQSLLCFQEKYGLTSQRTMTGPFFEKAGICEIGASSRLVATAAHANLFVGGANYVLHRLPTTRKVEFYRHVAALPSDGKILVIGDLIQNASMVNTGYFNFRDNGLLNPGNIEAIQHLKAAGFTVVGLTPTFLPPEMRIELAQKLENGVIPDGFFYIAYQGATAERALREFGTGVPL